MTFSEQGKIDSANTLWWPVLNRVAINSQLSDCTTWCSAILRVVGSNLTDALFFFVCCVNESVEVNSSAITGNLVSFPFNHIK